MCMSLWAQWNLACVTLIVVSLSLSSPAVLILVVTVAVFTFRTLSKGEKDENSNNEDPEDVVYGNDKTVSTEGSGNNYKTNMANYRFH